MPVLELDRVTVCRGPVRILRDISWRIQPGEHWVVLGSNGCGKTSMLAALTGYLMPTSGEMDLLGERFGESDWRELRTQVGIVSSSIRQRMEDSEPALDTVASGRYAMIDFWGRPNAVDRRQAMRLLKSVGCGGLADRPWAVLSQGERQRILIARALMARPRLMILDEPCAGLDPIARERFLQFLDRFGKPSTAPSLVLVTHHVEEITAVFTHVLMLRRGRTIAAGPLRSVMKEVNLSKVFDTRVRLGKWGGRYRLAVRDASRRVV